MSKENDTNELILPDDERAPVYSFDQWVEELLVQTESDVNHLIDTETNLPVFTGRIQRKPILIIQDKNNYYPCAALTDNTV